VVTGQVRVQKRTVQDTEKVSDKVQHEELRVEREGDVNVTDESTVSDQQKKISDQKKPIRKKPAA
jgi:stress response protein YsnF